MTRGGKTIKNIQQIFRWAYLHPGKTACLASPQGNWIIKFEPAKKINGAKATLVVVDDLGGGSDGEQA